LCSRCVVHFFLIFCSVFIASFVQVDLATLNIKNIRDSYGGAAWCVASSSRSPVLAVGCEDGQVRIYNYDGANLEFQKTLPVSGSRIVSIAYHPSEPLLFIGCIDGTIRCMDEVNVNLSCRMFYFILFQI
jgi:U3 small nucleolar RNA-associated protein 4